MGIINAKLLLRFLNIQEFFAHQWLMSYPNDRQKFNDLIQIRQKQMSLKNLVLQQEEDEGSADGGGGRGTIKGLRAKDDPNFRNTKDTHRKMVRR